MRIRNWRKHQHFKDRNPPWIKVYRELLNDPDWHALTGDDAKTLIMLWLVGSEDKERNGALPCVEKLAFRLRMTEAKLNQAISRLCKWLEQDDITAISERYQDVTPETETETEYRDRDINSICTDTAQKPPVSAGGALWGKGRVFLDPEKRTWIGLDKSDYDMWQTAYPAVDVQLELTRAIAWCLSDPKRGRKSNYLKFLSGWFSRSQDRGGSRNGTKPTHGLRPVTDYSGRDKEMFEGETVKQIAERL